MSVITNSLAMMDTSSAVTSLDADAVVYDNTTSGLSATDAQAAIDELDNTIDTISTEIGSMSAADVGYTKTIPSQNSGPPTAITDVQEAFDYLLGGSGACPVPSTIVNYQDCTGFIFYNTQSVYNALHEVDHVLSNFLENTSSGGYVLPADNIKIDNEQSGVYEQAQTVQDALSITSSYLNNGELIPISSTTATRYNEAETLDAVLTIIDNALGALEQGGGSGGGASTATDVYFTIPTVPVGQTPSVFNPNTDNVQQALTDLDIILRDISADQSGKYIVPSSCVNYDACYGILVNSDAVTISDAVDYISTYLADGATNIVYTKPQSSIYSSNTDTVKEALDDVSTVIQALDSTDIAIPAASKTGIYANAATVQAALDAIKTAIAGGGGGGSSSASSVSFTKPQGGIYESSTDTVQEALEDVSAKVLDLAASDITYVNGCGGSYPTEVETVHDALECLQHLLLKYSEFEAETGWLWFNDKPIYQVSVEPESGITNLFDTNELEIDDLVYMEATLTNSGGTKRWTISGSSGDFYWDTATHMIVYGGSDVVTTATIRYTKTSD